MMDLAKWILERYRAKVYEERGRETVAKVAACFDNPLGGVR